MAVLFVFRKEKIMKELDIIKQGVDTIIGEEELIEKLKQGKALNVKLGLDPSAPDIHLGHTVVLRKAKQLQDLGHNVIIIIGDFTGRIGDPTGRSKTRKQLTNEEVKENAKTFCEQVFKVLDKNKTTVRFNSEWLGKMSFEDVINLAATTTVSQLLTRNDFSNRFNNNQPIGLHEFFYPLMQGFDSVAIDADIEIGGTDQTFNVCMGRTLQKQNGKELPQTILMMPIIEGLDGVQKMSKSLGNHIGINEEPEVMFKKCMEIPDNLIIRFCELVSAFSPDKIKVFKEKLDNGENPRNIKLILAKHIVELFHGKENAEIAKKFFIDAFQKNKTPDNIPELKVNVSTFNELIPLLTENNFSKSNSDVRRLLKQGGVKLNNEVLNDVNKEIKNSDVIKLGKKVFVKIIN